MMSRFYTKVIILCIPFIVALGLYFYFDPFMVLRTYPRYDQSDVFINENLIGWKIYQKYKKIKHFNSFIMGNSCTQAFKCKEWEKYLKPGSHAMRFFDNQETIGGFYKKLLALDKDNTDIKNILLVMDWDSFSRATSYPGNLHIMPPEADPDQNRIIYQLKHIQTFFYPDFIFPFMIHKWNPNYCKRGVVHNFKCIRDSVNNDAINPNDKLIASEGEMYWRKQKKMFETRKEYIVPPVINKDVTDELKKIQSICLRHHTQFNIVIGPNFKLKKINPIDLNILRTYFGTFSVHDFSGLNNMTRDYHNYYDKSHYRPNIGNEIMKAIYRQNQN